MTSTPARTARIITVGSGKGGVGKSIVAANLAVAIAESGTRVVLIDADLAGANLHTLFGLGRPHHGLGALLDYEIESISDATVSTDLPNLHLVLGSGSIRHAGSPQSDHVDRIQDAITQLDCDVVVLDLGNGFDTGNLDLFNLGDVRLLVSTPQLTSVQNSYTYLKAAVVRALLQTATADGGADVLRAVMTFRETERIDDVLDRVQRESPSLAQLLAECLAQQDLRLLGNMVPAGSDAGIFRGTCRMLHDFLGVNVPYVGSISSNRQLNESVNRRRPFMLMGFADDDDAIFRNLAGSLLRRVSAQHNIRTTQTQEVRGELAAYLRRHPRVNVGWTAVLESGPRLATAEVVDVSAGGVGIRTRHRLGPGERWNLVLSEPRISVTVPIVVRHVRSDASHFGLSFVANEKVGHQIYEAAQISDRS